MSISDRNNAKTTIFYIQIFNFIFIVSIKNCSQFWCVQYMISKNTCVLSDYRPAKEAKLHVRCTSCHYHFSIYEEKGKKKIQIDDITIPLTPLWTLNSIFFLKTQPEAQGHIDERVIFCNYIFKSCYSYWIYT